MAPNLMSGTFRIVSLVDGESPVSVNRTRPAFQSVYLNGPVTTWTVTQEGEKTYRFGVGGYAFTGLIGNHVIASIHPDQNVEWLATYGEAQDAYIISPVNNTGMVWTVADPNNANSRIVLKTGKMMPSEPPQFLTTQLFRFEEVDE